MQFFYHSEAKAKTLDIDGELYRHIAKSRRAKMGDIVMFHNLHDDLLYSYIVEEITKRAVSLSLKDSTKTAPKPSSKLHIGWCITDPKNIGDTLAKLNELNLHKLTFIYCDFSQKNFAINIDKLDKIVINSSCQCGRTDKIELDICESLAKFHEIYPDSFVLNFCDNHISKQIKDIKHIVVGCEGGLSETELANFHIDKIVGLGQPYILKSSTAVVATMAQF